jgi:hypothetical protein
MAFTIFGTLALMASPEINPRSRFISLRTAPGFLESGINHTIINHVLPFEQISAKSMLVAKSGLNHCYPFSENVIFSITPVKGKSPFALYLWSKGVPVSLPTSKGSSPCRKMFGAAFPLPAPVR